MTREDMERLTAGETVIAEKIRILHGAGASRSEIADFLGKRYQHVHNVLKRCGLLEKPGEAEGSDRVDSSTIHTVTLQANGTIALPPEWLEAQQLGEGALLILREQDGGLSIISRTAAVQALRDEARQLMPGQAPLLEALLADRFRST